MGLGPIVLTDKVRSLGFDKKSKRTSLVEYGRPKDGQVYILLALGVAHPSEITPELIKGLVDHYRDSEWFIEDQETTLPTGEGGKDE